MLFPKEQAIVIFLNINLHNFQDESISIEIHDVLGREVLADLINEDESTTELDISNFQNGVYNLTLFVNGTYYDSRKFAVSK